METKTIDTHHVPVRYFEGGKGQPLVYLHGAGGIGRSREAHTSRQAPLGTVRM